MELITRLNNFISQPFPLWESEITGAVSQIKWEELKQKKILSISEYSTARVFLEQAVELESRYQITNGDGTADIYVEAFSMNLSDFYDDHGLVLYSEAELESIDGIKKIESALSIFKLVKPIQFCIYKLTRAIQVLKQEDMEIDVSYSHPKIPFSIFVSVCADDSIISNLRVAESILHEAMHLKLTLIEKILPLVKTNTGNLFFSPWREEKRPAQGILHGLFVFSAVHDFYNTLLPLYNAKEVIRYLNFRIEEIESEIKSLCNFSKNIDLTNSGSQLASNLTRY